MPAPAQQVTMFGYDSRSVAPGPQENELYTSPWPVAKAVCERLDETIKPTRIIEPSAGAGNIVAAARRSWPTARIVAAELDMSLRELLAAGADAVHFGDWERLAGQEIAAEATGTTLIVGNPPFSLAVPHVLAGLELLSPGEHLAFLLPVGFRASKDRVPFWDGAGKQLRSMSWILPRPAFVLDKTDQRDVALFDFERGFTGPAVIGPSLLWDEPKAT